METELCSKKKLSVFFKDIHKFTWVSGVDGRESLMVLNVVQEEDRNTLFVEIESRIITQW